MKKEGLKHLHLMHVDIIREILSISLDIQILFASFFMGGKGAKLLQAHLYIIVRFLFLNHFKVSADCMVTIKLGEKVKFLLS